MMASRSWSFSCLTCSSTSLRRAAMRSVFVAVMLPDLLLSQRSQLICCGRVQHVRGLNVRLERRRDLHRGQMTIALVDFREDGALVGRHGIERPAGRLLR